MITVLSTVVVWRIWFDQATEDMPHEVLLILAYLANWALIGGDLHPPLAHMWSLAVEEQFYLVWPIAFGMLAAKWSRLLGGTLTAITASLFISLLLAAAGSGNITYRSDTAALLLLMGCAMAIGERMGLTGWVHRLSIWPLVISVVAVPVCYIVLHVPPPWVDAIVQPLIAVGAAIAAIAATESRLLTWRPLVTLGLYSYSVYLWQTPLSYNGVIDLPGWAQLPLIALLAWLTWRFIETPLRLKGHDVARRWAYRPVHREAP